MAQVRAALVGADGVAAMARKASVLAAHPEGQRNFYRFRDDEYANCNVYALANRKAEQLFGCPRRELVGHHIGKLLPPSVRRP